MRVPSIPAFVLGFFVASTFADVSLGSRDTLDVQVRAPIHARDFASIITRENTGKLERRELEGEDVVLEKPGEFGQATNSIRADGINGGSIICIWAGTKVYCARTQLENMALSIENLERIVPKEGITAVAVSTPDDSDRAKLTRLLRELTTEPVGGKNYPHDTSDDGEKDYHCFTAKVSAPGKIEWTNDPSSCSPSSASDSSSE